MTSTEHKESQRSIVITGCSSGIGYAAAHHLKGRGWRVFACCRQRTDCARLAAEGFETFQVDYADNNGLIRAAAGIREACNGHLHALFNNGATSFPGALSDLSIDELENVWQVNALGPSLLIKLLVEDLSRARGRVVNCSSVLGVLPLPYRGAYTSSKRALDGLTDVWRLELSRFDIKVITIQPGLVRTGFGDNSGKQAKHVTEDETSLYFEEYNKRFGAHANRHSKRDLLYCDASDVVRVLDNALDARSPRRVYVVSWFGKLALFLYRVLPWRLSDRILSKI